MTVAWILRPEGYEPAFLQQDVVLPDLHKGQSRVRPLAVGWEGNNSHAIERKPLDVSKSRAEDRIVLGNNGVVELLETASEDLKRQAEGCDGVFLVQPIFHPGAVSDNGSLISVFGYDMRGSGGLLSRETIVPDSILLPLPVGHENVKYWASFTIRYMTAWSLFFRASRVFSVLHNGQSPQVFAGWGGGTTLALLQLAKLQGHDAVMFCSTAEKCAEAALHGIAAVNTTDLMVALGDGASEGDIVKAFRVAVSEALGRRAEIDVMVDFVGTPTADLTLALLRRGGVMATAGWKTGPMTRVNRALSAIKHHTHVYAHHANISEIADCLAFAIENDWCSKRVRSYDFDQVDALHSDYIAGRIDSYFPVVSFD